MVKPETGMVFIVGDGTQKIYQRGFTWKELGLGITAQNSVTLTHSYRTTHEIVDVALEAIRNSDSLLADLKSTGDGLVEPDDAQVYKRHGPLPLLLAFDTPEKEHEYIANEILTLVQRGCDLKDIVILQRHRSGHGPLAQVLVQRGVATRIIDGNLDINDPVVKICTLHSAKGLEFETVFVCGLEQFAVAAQDAGTLQALLDQERRLLYVGMTRARQRLYITYNGVAPDWIADRLQQKLAAFRAKAI